MLETLHLVWRETNPVRPGLTAKERDLIRKFGVQDWTGLRGYGRIGHTSFR